MEAIITALITGGLSLAGVVFSNMSSNKKMENSLNTQQAVMNEKISELTREVREHNNFAKRMPVVEEQVKVINHRIADIEKKIN